MYSENTFNSGLQVEPFMPPSGPAPDRHLELVRQSVADQVSALLDEETGSEVAVTDATGAADDVEQAVVAEPEVLEGRVVESHRRRIGRLGTKLAVVGQLGARKTGELATGVAALRKPVARVAGELAIGVKEAVNQMLDDIDRREEERAEASRAQQADINTQRELGSPGFCLADLTYEKETGRVSPRRVVSLPRDTFEQD